MNTQPAGIRIAIIAAVGKGNNPETNGIYGVGGKLPWPRLSKDFAWFKGVTAGHIVIMGRGTWDSLEKPKPLPNRLNIVVSNSLPEGKNLWNNDEKKVFFVCRSLDQALALAKKMEPEKNIFIIGGFDLWHHAIHYCTDLLITHVHGDYGSEDGSEIRKFPALLDPISHFPEHNVRLACTPKIEIEKKANPPINLTFFHYKVGPITAYNE